MFDFGIEFATEFDGLDDGSINSERIWLVCFRDWTEVIVVEGYLDAWSDEGNLILEPKESDNLGSNHV